MPGEGVAGGLQWPDPSQCKATVNFSGSPHYHKIASCHEKMNGFYSRTTCTCKSIPF